MLTSKNKAANSRDKSREKRVERELSHNEKIEELNDTSEESVDKKGVNELDFGRSLLLVLLQEVAQDLSHAVGVLRHFLLLFALSVCVVYYYYFFFSLF